MKSCIYTYKYVFMVRIKETPMEINVSHGNIAIIWKEF